jgi:hypothetical protein
LHQKICKQTYAWFFFYKETWIPYEKNTWFYIEGHGFHHVVKYHQIMNCTMDLVIIVYDMVLYEWAYIPRCCKLSSIITCINDLKMMVKHWKIERFR